MTERLLFPSAAFRSARAPLPPAVVVDGTTLALEATAKPVRNINARLRGNVLVVSYPRDLDPDRVREAIPVLARRLLRGLARRRARGEVDLLALARRVAARFPEPPIVDAVDFSTTQTSWWGLYRYSDRTILLASVLRHMPAWVMEAVMAHELAHSFHRRHGRRFRALLRRVCPEAERADAFLAGVSWLAHGLKSLPPVERGLLLRIPPGEGHPEIG